MGSIYRVSCDRCGCGKEVKNGLIWSFKTPDGWSYDGEFYFCKKCNNEWIKIKNKFIKNLNVKK